MDDPSLIEQDERYELLTPREAAELLRVSTKTLDGLVHDGALPYVNVGRGSKKTRRMFRRRHVNAFIEQRTRTNVPSSTFRGRLSSLTRKRDDERNALIAERRKRLLEDLGNMKRRR